MKTHTPETYAFGESDMDGELAAAIDEWPQHLQDKLTSLLEEWHSMSAKHEMALVSLKRTIAFLVS